MLPKFQIRDNSTKIYIPMHGQDYAVVCSENMGEMPLNFKAEGNGAYSINVNADNMEMSYLHLIDSMTGADIDLLETPCYSFEAKTTDYVSRFKLVFSACEGADDGKEIFAYISNGNLVVLNEGEATLQVIDMMGRVLSSETFNGNAEISLDQTPSVYMLRLINGNDVKTQKILIK